MATLQILSKPEKRVGSGVDGAIDLVLESGTRDIEYFGAFAVREDGRVEWFHNDLSNKELVWLIERCKLAILENERIQPLKRS